MKRKSAKRDPYLLVRQRIARSLEGIEECVDIYVFNTEAVQENIAQWELEEKKRAEATTADQLATKVVDISRRTK